MNQAGKPRDATRTRQLMRLLTGGAVGALIVGAAGAASAQTTAGDPTVEEVIVTGVRASIVQGLEIKRQSTQIVESVVAEDIGKLPDNNVVEALQRVTGVQVTNRTGGEASAIFIRGLPDITTTWNGRNVFTASGRQLALADIPANLVSRIDVYKTRAAEQIETGIAGQIDVFTRRPFDFKGPAFSVAARGIWHEQAGEFNPNISALVSNRWDTSIGEVGALVNVSYARTKFRDQSVTAGAMVPFATATNPPAGFTPLERFFPTDGRVAGGNIWQPGNERGLPMAAGSTLLINGQQTPYLLSRDAVFASDFLGDRERPAVNAALQWAPNDRSVYTFEFFYDGYRNETFNNLLFTFVDWWGNLGPNPASSYQLFEGTNVIKSRTVGAPFNFNSGDFTRQSTDSYVYALNGKWDLTDNLQVVADLAYQTSEFNTAFLAMRTTRVPDRVTVDFNQGDGLTAFRFGDNNQMLNPANWTVGEFYDNAGRNKGDAITFSADADWTANMGPLKKVSFGLRWDDRGASEANRVNSAGALNRSLLSMPSGLYWINNDFFDGRSDVPRSWMVANGYYIADHADEIRQLYNLPQSAALRLNETFNVDETTKAAYLQADFELPIFGRPLYAQAGVRYVDVTTEMKFINGTASTGDSQQVSDYLPSVTLRYDITEDLRLRFNYGKTLRRPNFVDLNPNITYNDDVTGIGYGTASGGNPNLEATRATNYDVALEWYFSRDSAIYGTVFRREIDGLVVPFRRRVTNPAAPSTPNTDTFILSQPDNASDGKLEGFELGFVYFPEYLPGIFKGLGVQGSLTKLKSSQNIPITNAAGDVIDEATTDFFGVSDFSYNITAAYERGPIGARLSYVWRDKFLNNNEAALFANPIGIWRRPEKSLDFQLTYSVNDRLAVTFDAVNLTDELMQSYYAFEDAGSENVTNFGSTILSRTFALGLRYTFD